MSTYSAILQPHLPSEVISRLVQWGEAHDAVRLMLLTSTRAVPDAQVDELSDYDLILVVRDILPWYEDRTWLADFGDVLVTYWDPIHKAPGYDFLEVGSVIQYADGLKIDFTLWPVELVQEMVSSGQLTSELDAGYRLLLDKDRLGSELPPPTGRAYLPEPPSEIAFSQFVEEFLSDAPYVAKCLLRDELLPVKWCLDYDMKHVYLRRLLEWRAASDTGWSQPASLLGKGLKQRLSPELWSLIEASYAGAGIEANWQALFRTLDAFRIAGQEVAARLGFVYPLDLDLRVTAFVKAMYAVHMSNDIGS